MNANDDQDTAQEKAWGVLFDSVREVLQQFGVEDPFGKGDYLVVDDNYGFRGHKVEIHTLRMLDPQIVKALQLLLRRFPDWEIIIAVGIPGKEKLWPLMGLTIRAHEIVDGLQRQWFPPEYRDIHYPGSRPGTERD
jgi:hypothetical protein